METNKRHRFSYLPIILMLVVVPAIVTARLYENHISGFAWYSNNQNSYDFFLYWKSRAIILTGIFVLCFWGYTFVARGTKSKSLKKNVGVFAPLGIYLVFSLVSAIFSNYLDFAFWGGFEQFEGMFVILTYILIVFYAYFRVDTEDDLHLLYSVLLCGVGIVSVIGAFQAWGADFYKTTFGQGLMTMLEPTLSGRKLSFNFEVGRTYATLYNPNYVGSYVALLLPVMISAIFVMKKKWQKWAMGIVAFLLVVSLMGSQSMTGYISLFAVVILFLVLFISHFKRWRKQFLMGSTIFIVTLLGVFFVNQDVFQYGYDKIFNVKKSDYAVQSIFQADTNLVVESGENRLSVEYQKDGSDGYLEFKEIKEQAITYDSEEKKYVINQGDFAGFSFQLKKMATDEGELNGFTLKKDGHTWDIVKRDSIYYFVSAYGKLDFVHQVESIGFEGVQHFASRRGFIWSRTIPLLKQHLVLGSGPDTFVVTFPNNDYVGMENNDYTGQVVTKPHNMYFQMAIQTGGISLAGFLVFYLMYFVQSFRIYFRRENYHIWECSGVGIFLGTFGYMVTGLANDSSVTTAPIFWTLLGVGLAVNYKIKYYHFLEK